MLGGWMKVNIPSHEKNVLKFINLAVNTNIGTNNGVHTLDVKVFLDFGQQVFVLLVVNDEVGNNFNALDLLPGIFSLDI